jgi:hypothetical protein
LSAKPAKVGINTVASGLVVPNQSSKRNGNPTAAQNVLPFCAALTENFCQ